MRRPVRITPALEDREAVRALFDANAPFPSAATYLPDGSDEATDHPADAVLPWFRSTWAVGGVPRIAGIEPVLYHDGFIAAARAFFATDDVVPTTVVVNVNAPMPAGVPHVDVPAFHGATRDHLPLRLLIAMGASGVFERWRIVEAGIIAWWYEGRGGAFDYWPDGLAGAMESVAPPFGNLAVLADSDRMFHRIAAIGEDGAALPRMTAAAQIRPIADGWVIEEAGTVRARYAADQVRLSMLWKADIGRSTVVPPLEPAQIEVMLAEDLRRRGLATDEPSRIDNPAWVAFVYRAYLASSR